LWKWQLKLGSDRECEVIILNMRKLWPIGTVRRKGKKREGGYGLNGFAGIGVNRNEIGEIKLESILFGRGGLGRTQVQFETGLVSTVRNLIKTKELNYCSREVC